MIYESDLYSIEYDKKSEKLVQSITETLSQNFQRVFDFLGIEKLNNHANIQIFSELDEWIKFFEISDWQASRQPCRAPARRKRSPAKGPHRRLPRRSSDR